MKKNVIIVIVSLLVMIGIFIGCKKFMVKDENNITNYTEDFTNSTEQEEVKTQEGLNNETEKQTETQEEMVEKEKIERLKQETGITGNTDLYFVGKEYDGREALAIKPEVSFQVAFAGVLEKEKPTFENLSAVLEQLPKKSGIWVEENSREKWIEILNQVTGNSYKIDEKGFVIKESGQADNKYSKAIDEMIESTHTYIIAIQTSCYVVDIVTGEITENLFEQMDPYQVCEVFQEGENQLFVITTNLEKRITNQEIVDTMIRNKI